MKNFNKKTSNKIKNNLKKWLALTLVSAMFTLSFTACGEKDFVSFDDLYAALAAEPELKLADSNMQKSEQTALDNFYYIDSADIKDNNYLIYISDPATGNADEIAMFEVADPEKVVTIKALIQDRINDLSVRYESYKPEEMKKIKQVVVESKGNYVVMVICSNGAKAKEIIGKML